MSKDLVIRIVIEISIKEIVGLSSDHVIYKYRKYHGSAQNIINEGSKRDIK